MDHKESVDELMFAIGATAEMISHFYKTCVKNGIPPDAALVLTGMYLDNLMSNEVIEDDFE